MQTSKNELEEKLNDSLVKISDFEKLYEHTINKIEQFDRPLVSSFPKSENYTQEWIFELEAEIDWLNNLTWDLCLDP